MIDYHRRMLADDVRHKAFHKALEKVNVSGFIQRAFLGSEFLAEESENTISAHRLNTEATGLTEVDRLA
jgi:hypothetical protein